MKDTHAYKIFTICNYIFLTLFILISLYPFIYVVSISFSSEKSIYGGAVKLLPVDFTLDTYKTIMKDEHYWTYYKNTFYYTIVGTLVSLVLTTMLAYSLSKKDLIGRDIFLPFIVFTMFFGGGLIPNFVLVSTLNMRNTVFSIIIPGAISTYNMIIMKSFFESLPKELEEAAHIDGMGTYGVLLKIVLPLSKAILATMTLFYAVGAWNNWFGPMIYLDSRPMYPMALHVRNLVMGASTIDQSSIAEGGVTAPTSIRSGTMVLSCLPILCVYPFVQKYFVKGVMIGSIKG